MKIAIGCDHGGVALKNQIIPLLAELGVEVDDKGCHSVVSVDYPEFAGQVCVAIQEGGCDRGILICGTGIGMSMAANRFKGIRAALCNDLYCARMSREHNDANVLCIGGRVVGQGVALEIVRTWVNTAFAGGRHQRRIDMF